MLKIELDELYNLNKENIDKLLIREEKLNKLNTSDIRNMSEIFKSKVTLPWYRRYQYQVGGVSVITILSLLFI